MNNPMNCEELKVFAPGAWLRLSRQAGESVKERDGDSTCDPSVSYLC